MTPDSAGRILRACLPAASKRTQLWTEDIQAVLDCTKAEAERQRKAHTVFAMDSLRRLIERHIEDAAVAGIDPGRKGDIEFIDVHGDHVHTIVLGSLYQDEAIDGPAARRRHNDKREADRKLAIANKTPMPKARYRDPAKGDRALWRFDPVALEFVATIVREMGIPVWIEDAQYRPGINPGAILNRLTAVIAEGAPRARKMAVLMSELNRGESAQSAATIASNHRALVQAFCIPHNRIVPALRWQRRWSCPEVYPDLAEHKRYHHTPDRLNDCGRPWTAAMATDRTGTKASKARSVMTASFAVSSRMWLRCSQ